MDGIERDRWRTCTVVDWLEERQISWFEPYARGMVKVPANRYCKYCIYRRAVRATA